MQYERACMQPKRTKARNEMIRTSLVILQAHIGRDRPDFLLSGSPVKSGIAENLFSF